MDTIMDAGTGLFESVLRDMQSSPAAPTRSGGVTARDLLVLLKSAAAGPDASAAELARGLEIPAADVSLGLERGRRVGLVDAAKRRIQTEEFLEFCEHGLRFVFPAEVIGPGRVLPFDPAVPRAAATDARLKELFKHVDALRGGERRARSTALRELRELLREYRLA